MDELVCTILSQNTNDRNRDVAFNNLKQRFSGWEEVRDAPLADLIASIRPAGLANQKGARIQDLLRQVTAEKGSLDLGFLNQMSPDEVKDWLTQFKGVGLKTASIVMVFSLDMPAFPVDTHIYRVSGRLGLRPQKMNVENAHAHLASLFTIESFGPAHLLLITLGREICQARKPACPKCPVSSLCDFYRQMANDMPKNQL